MKKSLFAKLVALLLNLVIILSIASIAVAKEVEIGGDIQFANLPASIRAAFNISPSDKITYYQQEITDVDALVSRAKRNVQETSLIPAFTCSGAEDASIMVTTQKLMERTTSDGTQVTTLRASAVISFTSGAYVPGNASNKLYYVVGCTYNGYTHPNWSGYKVRVTQGSGEYLRNDSTDTGINSWELNTIVPNSGYRISDGVYTPNAHSPGYDWAYKVLQNPSPGYMIYLSNSEIKSYIPTYGTYCYDWTQTSLVINTQKGSTYSVRAMV